MQKKIDFDFNAQISAIKWKIKAKETKNLIEKDKMLCHLQLFISCDESLKIHDSINEPDDANTCGLFFHLRSYGILENIQHIRPFIQKAMNSFDSRKFEFHDDDVVIHVRTGDIFSNKHEAFYSSIHFSNYVELLKHKTIHNIYIVWKSDRKQDRAYDTYNKALICHLRKYLNLNLNVNVIIDRQKCDDFVFMTQAPLLIACISTYSLWAALINPNYSIIPQCTNHFNNRLYTGDHFQIVPFCTLNKYKKDINEFLDQFT
tara:strand:+ start:2693 stop:3472 length:780 start_codon:yes stop_codon:yes gene_type:complete